jgi:branched-chain amino acid transport system permease protein
MSDIFASVTLRGRVVLGVLTAALLVAPFLVDRYILAVLLLALLGAYLGQAWNIMMGFCGLLSLGHSLYIGLGAYAAAALFVKFGVGPWVGVFVAIGLCLAVATAIGWLGFSFQIEGVYFSLLTLAFAEIARIGFDNFPWLGGAAGYFLPIRAAEAGQWHNLRGGPFFFYYLALALAAGSVVFTAALRASKLGHAWLAIREDAQAARALGINITHARFVALFVSAGMTSVGGVFIAFWTNNLFPAQIFDVSRSIDIILAPLIGGVGTIFGPVVGAFLLVPLGEAVTEALGAMGVIAPGAKSLVYGLLLMGIISAAPGGLWPYLAGKFGLQEKKL